MKTVATEPSGAHAIFADAIDDKTAAFYAAFGFTPLARRPRTLYLPVAAAAMPSITMRKSAFHVTPSSRRIDGFALIDQHLFAP